MAGDEVREKVGWQARGHTVGEVRILDFTPSEMRN